jgi:hypothetical protein
MNIDKSIFLFCIFYYFYCHRKTPFLFDYIFKIYSVSINFLTFYNKIIHPDYWMEKSSETELDENKTISDNIVEEIEKPQKKYEDKYLDDIRRLNKEWEFTDSEKIELSTSESNLFNDCKKSRIEKMDQIQIEIDNLQREILEDIDTVNYVDDYDEEGDELIRETTLDQRNEGRKKQILLFSEEYEKIKSEVCTEEGLQDLKNNALQISRQNIINNRLKKLANCFVMEKTPIGNVLMIYDLDLCKFKYYSDATMPYRYLEVVGRKYVKIFNCRPIFVDMEEELRLFEEKWERDQKIKKEKEDEEKLKDEEATKKLEQIEAKKKNVFAKFKSYNKDASSKISMAPPPKNSIPSKSITENKENEKVLLKENANSYTYDGKISNFSFLKKVEKKIFNKKLGFSFADFKKMNQKQN